MQFSVPMKHKASQAVGTDKDCSKDEHEGGRPAAAVWQLWSLLWAFLGLLEQSLWMLDEICHTVLTCLMFVTCWFCMCFMCISMLD